MVADDPMSSPRNVQVKELAIGLDNRMITNDLRLRERIFPDCVWPARKAL